MTRGAASVERAAPGAPGSLAGSVSSPHCTRALTMVDRQGYGIFERTALHTSELRRKRSHQLAAVAGA